MHCIQRLFDQSLKVVKRFKKYAKPPPLWELPHEDRGWEGQDVSTECCGFLHTIFSFFVRSRPRMCQCSFFPRSKPQLRLLHLSLAGPQTPIRYREKARPQPSAPLSNVFGTFRTHVFACLNTIKIKKVDLMLMIQVFTVPT